MDLATVTMPRTEARRLFLEYRRALSGPHTEEDEQIMRGYRAIARGQQVISLRASIAAGGQFNDGKPKLAVARADAEACWLEERLADGRVTFTTKPDRNSNNVRDVRRFPAGTLKELNHPASNEVRHWTSRWGWKAIVPPVPPALRPARGLGLYDVLWEVPEWVKVPEAPGDPALIRHIGGELYAVVAVWDLTELERLVINGRAR